jgi:hypothetical protein
MRNQPSTGFGVTAKRQMQRGAGAAGLGYVLGAAIENMAILESPLIGSPIPDIRSAYADQALVVVTSVAGALALLFYAAFAVGVFRLVRGAERRVERWALVALVGGIAGPALAAVGLAATGPLVVNAGQGLSGDTTRSLFDVYLYARFIAGPLMATFLFGIGLAAMRSRALPAWLARVACRIAIPLALTPLAAFTGEHSLQIAAAVAFGLHSLWILLVSLWLTLGQDVPLAILVRRAAFLMLVLAAGLVGIALVAVPASSGAFFSWGLEPTPLAAFAGGVYVGSATVFAAALQAPWREVRGLVIGAVVLSISVFVITIGHLEVFDFHRLQAWAWVVLFAAFALITSALLVTAPHEEDTTPSAMLEPWARAALAVIAALLAVLAVALWVDPTGLASLSPYALPPLGGRFAGSWIAMLAVLAGWAALRNRRAEARLPALCLVALPAGAFVAALRTISELDGGARTLGYLTVLALLAALAAAVAASTRAVAGRGEDAGVAAAYWATPSAGLGPRRFEAGRAAPAQHGDGPATSAGAGDAYSVQ